MQVEKIPADFDVQITLTSKEASILMALLSKCSPSPVSYDKTLYTALNRLGIKSDNLTEHELASSLRRTPNVPL